MKKRREEKRRHKEKDKNTGMRVIHLDNIFFLVTSLFYTERASELKKIASEDEDEDEDECLHLKV